MDKLDREQVEVGEIIFKMGVQLILILFGLGVFSIVFYKFIVSSNTFEATKFGAANAMLGSTIYLVYRHFFPSKNKEESKPKESPEKAVSTGTETPTS